MVEFEYIIEMYQANKLLKEDVLILIEVAFVSTLIKKADVVELLKVEEEKKGARFYESY